MKTLHRFFWTTLLLALVSTAAQAALPATIDDRPVTSLAPLVEAASPAVVNIGVTQVSRSPFGRSAEVGGAGSGVIVDAENGYILTNHHVVAEADEIQVGLIDGRTLDAEIMGSDAATDIALLKVEGDDLTEMPIGDSSGVRVGDFVIAIGNPYGLNHTVTSGIVSALGRAGFNRDGLEDFIQTDASINPGNSGGALVNMDGELIGINSVIISRSGGNVGIGFAVPTEIASSVMGQIIDFGEIRRGLLGVNIQNIDAEAARTLSLDVESGALVTRVFPESAAERAGLEVGDIIIGVNNKKIDDASGLRKTIGLLRTGDTVGIRYIRDNKTRSTSTELGSASEQLLAGANIHPGLNGATFAPNSASSDNGVEVTEVVEGSPAAQRGLRTGDVITAVNRVLVRNLDDLAEIAQGNRILFLLVRRGDRSLMLQIR
ncbi:MAG: Do family serine endopeptidase [Gammaproteobacteria bacterium]|nr:Do family serine endopeptidase [Gammaproteobacteria bacterium]NNF49911.1 Do family serine endopeptidase [Woeseiaceae bacterium]MBT8094652.1 Do family serine endopeptidase [Gammaproteobacteria bacterium]MBT8106126.1 Do family serine endopeptidase [Gammaproteobacteria bacterium]NNK26140.1 Do family serine endopeptidase [Woeseiaceae bacterium]